ncbi:hypothetical protein G7046_g169 [Stylonectria norvegica]|nr:hypothetical protein G7046_g169 [Stylonectria norvegica]
MPEHFVQIVDLRTVKDEDRDEALKKFDAIASAVIKNEPGVVKYGIHVPREDDGKTIVIIEEYVDKAAHAAHMATPAVVELIEFLTNAGVETTIHFLEYLPNFGFTRDAILTHPDPHVMFAELDYYPGGVDTSIPYWKAVVESGRENEPGTLMYGILKDPSKENRLVSIEAYESPAYLMEVHVPSKAIQESIGNTKHLRTGLKHHIMKRRGGFLLRE